MVGGNDANDANGYLQMSDSQLPMGNNTSQDILSAPFHLPPVGSVNSPLGSSLSKVGGMDDEGTLPSTTISLTQVEILQLRLLLSTTNGGDISSLITNPSMDSDYPAFKESTHAWAVFADNPQKRAGPWERLVGTIIIVFQLFAYRLFAAEAIEDFRAGRVPVMIAHQDCIDMELSPNDNFECEAEFTNTSDALVAFIMLGIFLAHDMLQSAAAIWNAQWGLPMFFAVIAGVEVVCAFLSASVAVSYHLFIGEATDAVEVGVGLLFIRELSQQTYHGIGSGKTKQFRNFFVMVMVLVSVGMVLDPLTAKIFAGYVQ